MLPPRLVRRIVFIPLVFLITFALVTFSPVLALAALISAPSRSGRRRALRLLWFALSWLVMESLALMASLALWIASGFGGRLHTRSWMDRHYKLVRWFLATLFRRAVGIFRLRVEIDEPEATEEELSARLARPVIVLSRHAGPGDSFLLVHHLLSRYQRRPRIVMKAALQLDPSLDVVINRLPHAFVHPHRRGRSPLPAPRPDADGQRPGPGQAPVVGQGPVAGQGPVVGHGTADGQGPVVGHGPADGHGHTPAEGMVSAEIRRLAASLGPTDALVIFPEGGNFTPGRWRRGIAALEQHERYDEADRARQMPNLLPPRSGGAFAAIDAAPSADVIFVAHTGLDDLVTVRDVWRALPMEQVIKARWWRVPAAEVPRERAEVVGWLFDWWERIDEWIRENRPIRSTSAP